MMTVSYAWDHEMYCGAVSAEIEGFAAVVSDADLRTPVPTCPEWTVADLVRHTGTIHRWAGAMVGDRAQRKYDRSEVDLDLPAETKDYPTWLAAGGRPLTDTLRAADPDTAMWAWGADQRARFWSRRMLHETTVHRCDAELALGTQPWVDPGVAVDGVDEFLVNLPHAVYFAPDVEKLRGRGETLAFRATDPNRQWRVVLGTESFTWQCAESADMGDGADVAVRGPSADLYLLVWGRASYRDRRYDVTGDESVLDRWVRDSAI